MILIPSQVHGLRVSLQTPMGKLNLIGVQVSKKRLESVTRSLSACIENTGNQPT